MALLIDIEERTHTYIYIVKSHYKATRGELCKIDPVAGTV